MNKEKKIITSFLMYIIAILSIVIVGITNVFALEYSTTYADTQYYYDNFGSSATLINSTWNSSLNAYVSSNLNTTANSYGGLVVFNSPIPIIANHTYTISLSFIERYNIALSSKSNIAIGNDYNGTKYNYVNNQNYANTLVKKVVNNAIIQYSFTASGAASYIAIPWTTTSNANQSYVFNSIIIEDLGSEGVSAQTIQNKLDAQANNINQTIENMQEQIIANQNTNNQAVINSIDDNLTDTIHCENLFKNVGKTSYGITTTAEDNGLFINGTTDSTWFDLTTNFSAGLSAGTYTMSISETAPFRITLIYTNSNNETIRQYLNKGSTSLTFKENYNINLVHLTADRLDTQTFSHYKLQFMLVKGTEEQDYCTFGTSWKENKIDETTKAIKEQHKTSKGILATIRSIVNFINPFSEEFFVYKLIDLLRNLLKELFVPSSEFIKNWYNDFKGWFEQKLGFLATPFTLFVNFIETFLNLEESNLVINIPRITIPNFEENVLIEERTFNWGELLNSKQEFKTLWELYLDFIDVFLILNFLGLCETKYNRIFGGDTTPYEYYTTEETYNINDETGEATNHMLRQRTTRREKVK